MSYLESKTIAKQFLTWRMHNSLLQKGDNMLIHRIKKQNLLWLSRMLRGITLGTVNMNNSWSFHTFCAEEKDCLCNGIEVHKSQQDNKQETEIATIRNWMETKIPKTSNRVTAFRMLAITISENCTWPAHNILVNDDAAKPHSADSANQFCTIWTHRKI